MGSLARRLTARAVGVVSSMLSRFAPLGRIWFFLTGFNRVVTIAYITKDDPELIAIAHDYYKRLGITVRVFLDDRTNDRSRSYLDERGIPFTAVVNPKDYVEALYEGVADHVETEWLLIITNDELLNVHSLVEASLRVRFDRRFACYGMQRSWVLIRNGAAYVGNAEFIGPDYQFRLVKHRAVRFHDEIHTPGFDLPDATGLLTPGSRLYHFDWVVRSRSDREHKLDVYEAKLPGARERYVKWYLPEDFPDDYDLQPLAEPGAAIAVDRYRQFVEAS